jgi:hypothetical protein
MYAVGAYSFTPTRPSLQLVAGDQAALLQPLGQETRVYGQEAFKTVPDQEVRPVDAFRAEIGIGVLVHAGLQGLHGLGSLQLVFDRIERGRYGRRGRRASASFRTGSRWPGLISAVQDEPLNSRVASRALECKQV